MLKKFGYEKMANWPPSISNVSQVSSQLCVTVCQIIIISKIQLVGQKNIMTKHLSQVKGRHQPFFTTKTLQIWRAPFATSGL